MRRLNQILKVLLTGLIEGSSVYGFGTAAHSPTESARAIREHEISTCARRGLRDIDAYLAAPAAGR